MYRPTSSNKSGAQPWVCRTAHGMRRGPAGVPECQSWTWVETAAAWASQIPRHTICLVISEKGKKRWGDKTGFDRFDQKGEAVTLSLIHI